MEKDEVEKERCRGKVRRWREGKPDTPFIQNERQPETQERRV